MPDLTYLFALLLCPLAMGAMMLMMMRGQHSNDAGHAHSDDEVARLRAEVDQLRAEREGDRSANDVTSAP